ncbi:MAG: hypothetical protein AAGD43_08140 [Pseudomonadota bacterium]
MFGTTSQIERVRHIGLLHLAGVDALIESSNSSTVLAAINLALGKAQFFQDIRLRMGLEPAKC